MKTLIVILTLVGSFNSWAGAQFSIPSELLELDHQGRQTFIKNSLAKIGVTTGNYSRLNSAIIGGEHTIHSEKKGAYMGYTATLNTQLGNFSCEERMPLGSIIETRPDLVGRFPVECKLSQ